MRKTNPTPGAVAARFVFWYAFPRIFIDLFRDYPTHRLALGTGQTLNLVMAGVGARCSCARACGVWDASPARVGSSASGSTVMCLHRGQRGILACLLAFCLAIPSNWTQDIPVRYGKRQPGLQYSWLYPKAGDGACGLRRPDVQPAKGFDFVNAGNRLGVSSARRLFPGRR